MLQRGWGVGDGSGVQASVGSGDFVGVAGCSVAAASIVGVEGGTGMAATHAVNTILRAMRMTISKSEGFIMF